MGHLHVTGTAHNYVTSCSPKTEAHTGMATANGSVRMSYVQVRPRVHVLRAVSPVEGYREHTYTRSAVPHRHQAKVKFT